MIATKETTRRQDPYSARTLTLGSYNNTLPLALLPLDSPPPAITSLSYPVAPPTPPQTPSPSQTPIRAPRKAYMTMDDLFAKFAEKAPKTGLLVIQKGLCSSPASPLTPATSIKAPKTSTAPKCSKSKVFETRSHSAPRTAAPANRNPESSASKTASTPNKVPESSNCSKFDLFKIKSVSASPSARKSLPNHVAPTSAQTASEASRFSPYKSTSTLRTSMSSPTPSRSSLLCALIRATVGQLRLLIAPHWPHRPPLKRWDIA